jgi:hypothetical protein
MRVLAVIVVLLALGALPAHAQMSKQFHRNTDNTNPVDQNKARADEKAYQDAVKRIPDPKEKYDPWGMTKTPGADKKPSK